MVYLAIGLISHQRVSLDKGSTCTVNIIFRTRSWSDAAHWYSKALEAPPTDITELDEAAVDEPRYSILARLAAMYNTGNNTCSQSL